MIVVCNSEQSENCAGCPHGDPHDHTDSCDGKIEYCGKCVPVSENVYLSIMLERRYKMTGIKDVEKMISYLDSGEFSEYMEHIRMDALDLGIYLPDPENIEPFRKEYGL